MNSEQQVPQRRSNKRLGLALGAIAVAFFFAIIAKKIWVG
jgi:hypothetical protein